MAISYSIFKSRFKKSIADSIYNEIISKSARYYHFLGKENAWTDFLSPFIPSQSLGVGDVPGEPSDNFRYELHVRRDILTTKLITSADVSYIVARINWTSGVIYDMYDDAISPTDIAPSGAVRLEDARFYVLTNDYNVYKCISNNKNAQSTHQPSGTSVNTFTTSDGYLWKFMYSIPISLRNRFLSADYMPVTTALKAQFFLNGEIAQTIIENGGSGYTAPQLIVSGDGYIRNNPYAISGITITNAGAGYASAPAVTFSSPTVTTGTPVVATGSVTISSGQINTATLITSGYGYTADPIAPVITVAPPVTGAINWIASGTFTLNTKLLFGGRFYNVTTAGIAGSTGPTHTSGSASNGSLVLAFLGTQAVLTPIMVKTEADIDAVLGSGGEIVNVTINDGGIGYTNANIQIVDATGTGAVISPNFNVGNVDTLQANVELLAVPGTIETMKVVTGGTGYGAAAITINGDGTGAAATAQIIGGKLTGITMTNKGSGYTWTDIVVTGNGSGAVVRAIMSPLKGHGNNAIDELNANSIMFYSSISRDKNQGLTITNDYRKAGLLKNITQFNSNNRFNDDVGSGCVLVTGIFDKSKLAYDQLLMQANATYKKYRIVEFTDTKILVSVFNNFTINIGDTLVNEAGYTIIVTAVKERTIDQFSGDFLFLTVREPFAPSEEQIITVRTVLTI